MRRVLARETGGLGRARALFAVSRWPGRRWGGECTTRAVFTQSLARSDFITLLYRESERGELGASLSLRVHASRSEHTGSSCILLASRLGLFCMCFCVLREVFDVAAKPKTPKGASRGSNLNTDRYLTSWLPRRPHKYFGSATFRDGMHGE